MNSSSIQYELAFEKVPKLVSVLGSSCEFIVGCFTELKSDRPMSATITWSRSAAHHAEERAVTDLQRAEPSDLRYAEASANAPVLPCKVDDNQLAKLPIDVLYFYYLH